MINSYQSLTPVLDRSEITDINEGKRDVELASPIRMQSFSFCDRLSIQESTLQLALTGKSGSLELLLSLLLDLWLINVPRLHLWCFLRILARSLEKVIHM
jgi:hypothetical protein